MGDGMCYADGADQPSCINGVGNCDGFLDAFDVGYPYPWTKYSYAQVNIDSGKSENR